MVGSSEDPHYHHDLAVASRSAPAGVQSAPSLWRSEAASLLVSNWFVIGIGTAVGVAYAYPPAGASSGPHHSIINATIHWLAIALIFLISGLSLSTAALRKEALNLRLHIYTFVIQFVIFPAIVFGIVSAVKAGQGFDGAVDKYILAGMVIMGCMPTTVASNINMTRLSGGNTEGATIEVLLSNSIGLFISPLMLVLFLSDRDGWGFATPRSADGGGLPEIYKQMSLQLALTLYVPLIVGQIVQNVFPKATKWAVFRLQLNRIGQLILLIIVWSAFCTSFYSGAFDRVSAATKLLVVFVSLGLLVFMNGLTFGIARLPFMTNGRSKTGMASRLRFERADTIALCYCAASKGLVLGQPLLAIFYSGYDGSRQGILLIPLVIYQCLQIGIGQLFVAVFKRWMARGSIPVAGDTRNCTSSPVPADNDKIVEPT